MDHLKMRIMNRNITITALLFALAALLTACKEDEIDVDNSIFDTTEKPLTGFDKWLDDNYRVAYNIQFRYKYEDLESDMGYNLIPAEYKKSAQMAKLVKFLWLDAYTELAGLNFTRSYAPRILFMVGSPAWRTATKVLGTAESGLKITLYDINNFDPRDIEMLNESYFKTMHHEFAHILHQTKMYDLTYGQLSASAYIGSSWSNLSDGDAAKSGFVSPYSSSSVNEDFVEVIARYVTQTDDWWYSLKTMAGDEGWPIIQQKIELVREYLDEKWGIDLDRLRSIVRRRTREAVNLDLSTTF